jgi:hypothetical protein
MAIFNTNSEMLRVEADKRGMPLRTLEQVKADLADAKRRSKGKNAGMDMALAGLMLRHGRLTVEARAYVEAYR